MQESSVFSSTIENHTIPCYKEVMPLRLVIVGSTAFNYFLLMDITTFNATFMIIKLL